MKIFKSMVLSLTLVMLMPVCVIHASESVTEVLEDGAMEAEVYASIDSVIYVTVPKKIVIPDNSNTIEYSVNVKGDISSNNFVIIEPVDFSDIRDYTGSQLFAMSDVLGVKNDLEAVVYQDKIFFTREELAITDSGENVGTSASGIVKVNNLNAGNYKGKFAFNIEVSTEDWRLNTTEIVLTADNCDLLSVSRSGDIVIPSYVEGADGVSYKITEIGEECFKDCIDITSIVIPNTVKYIDSYAFYNCTSLESIQFPNGISAFGQYAFYNCESLQEVILPSELCAAGPYVFANCKSLKEITIHSNFKSINQNSFQNCTSLKSVYFEGENINTIVPYLFDGCVNLETIVLPKNLISIQPYAFRNCKSLKGVVELPESLCHIGGYAFSSCTNVDCVKLPDTIQSISQYALQDVPYVHYIGTLDTSNWGAVAVGHKYENSSCIICGETE